MFDSENAPLDERIIQPEWRWGDTINIPLMMWVEADATPAALLALPDGKMGDDKMTDAEAIAWCVEHQATVDFGYAAYDTAGNGIQPYVAINVDMVVFGRLNSLACQVEAPTFVEAVGGAKALFDLAATRER